MKQKFIKHGFLGFFRFVKKNRIRQIFAFLLSILIIVSNPAKRVKTLEGSQINRLIVPIFYFLTQNGNSNRKELDAISTRAYN